VPVIPVPADPRAANQAWWEGAAVAHRAATEGYYDPAPIVAGGSSFGAVEERLLALAAPGGVVGREVLHLQCHLALDSITLARRGARVTGVDFSTAALDGARELASRCGVGLELVASDATALPAALHGRFDLVWATIGVLTWHADLGPWMRSVASALKPGGRLALVDLHPLFCMPATVEPLVVDFPYAGDGPRAFDEVGTYAAPGRELPATVSVSWAHSVGETVNAALGAGLRLDHLEEVLEADFDPRNGLLTRESDGKFRWRLGTGAPGEPPPPLPVYLMVVATKG